jgi:hypothetical protein
VNILRELVSAKNYMIAEIRQYIVMTTTCLKVRGHARMLEG